MTFKVTEPIYLIGGRYMLTLGPVPQMTLAHPILYAPHYFKERGFWLCESCKNACLANHDFEHRTGCERKVLSYGFGSREDICKSPLPPDTALMTFAKAMALIEQKKAEPKLRKYTAGKKPVV